MKATVSIQGMEQLEKQLEKINKNMEREAKASVLRQAETLKDRITARAPVGPTGRLKRSPVARMMPEKAGYPAIAIAGIDRKIAPHAHLVEFGTSRAPAYPFFRPAVDECADRIEGNLRSDIKKGIEEAV